MLKLTSCEQNRNIENCLLGQHFYHLFQLNRVFVCCKRDKKQITGKRVDVFLKQLHYKVFVATSEFVLFVRRL